MSPRRKKRKTDTHQSLKRVNANEGSTSKRPHLIKNNDDSIQAQRRKNFVTACEQVSCKAYLDHRSRLLLLYLPPNIRSKVSKSDSNELAKEMLHNAEELFMIDTRGNMWYNALEVCILCTTPTQYLSANVLKEIVEIMLNAHSDDYSKYSIPCLLSKCQQVLMENVNMHPPSLTKSLTKMYIQFLTSPLDLKEKTFSNRTDFGSKNGVVKYCMNRLEYEVSAESKEGCLLDKNLSTPKEMQHSVQGLHWQKENFEIYECLERIERIERLMVVLESIIQLLQIDLATWLTRYTNNLGIRLMKRNRPLIAHILWHHNILFTGAVTNECRQIMKIFAIMVHLRCPDKHIRIITMWLNLLAQIFYICDSSSNMNYPNTGKYSLHFATEFYKIVAGMPSSTIRIIEMIQPTYMRHLVGTMHLQIILTTEESCVMQMLIDFIKESKWEKYPGSENNIELSVNLFEKHKYVKNRLRTLTKLFNAKSKEVLSDTKSYPKMSVDMNMDVVEVNRNHIIHALFVTFKAYLEAYSVRDVQETIDKLNEQITDDKSMSVNFVNDPLPEFNSYSVTEEFIKKYRSIYQMLKEVVLLFQELKNYGELPEFLTIFENIDLLDI